MGEENKTTEESPIKEKKSKLSQIRSSHKARLWIIGILIVIVAILFIFWTKARIALAVALIALLAAFGLEVSQNDWDLGKLIETRSFEQSKIQRDTVGNLLYDKLGNLTTDSSKGKKADDYNCSDFTGQPEAQSFFNKVGGTSNDLNRLDGDKDGNACESLPKKGR